MKSQQSGFTLVEIAIVLVIIGLLLGGVLKGQELINSAKVKAFANDFRNIQAALYGYQDRYKSIPGDHASVATAVTGATAAPAGATRGNAQINGAWDSVAATDESCLVWQHLRLANFFPGTTTVDCAAGSQYLPTNADGGRIGISSTTQITGMTGTYFICSTGIIGKFAKQLDTQLDDGVGSTGTVRSALVSAPTAGVATPTDSDSYVVCMAL